MRTLRVLAWVMAAVLTLSALLVIGSRRDFPVPQASLGIGMNGGATLLGESDDGLAADLDAMRATGAGWLRVDIDWSSIEADRGKQDWTAADRVVNAAHIRGLRVLGIATYAPRWAQDDSVPEGTTHGRPSSAALFGTFAGQAAAHFAGRINAWEIWNEPNLESFFAPEVDAAFYTAMVQASYTAIHAAVPDATVVAGSLSPNTDDAAPAAFLQRMYAEGVKGFLDAVSTHPYSYPALPSGSESYNAFYQLRDVRQVMLDNGDDDKKIWLTEFGAPTGPGRKAVTEQRQAAIIADGLASARSLSYVGPLFVYEIRDIHTGSSDLEDNFGLLRTNQTQKPAYAVVVQQALEDTPTVPPS